METWGSCERLVPRKRVVTVNGCFHGTRGSFESRVPRKSVVSVNGCFHGNTGSFEWAGTAEKCWDCEWLFPWKHGVTASGGSHGQGL